MSRVKVDILRDLKSFLAPGGIVYISVPNFHKNIGDLFVVDHIQKFTSQSLEKLANLAGYSIKKISDKMLDSAWVAVLTAENIVRQHYSRKEISTKLKNFYLSEKRY